MNMLNEILNNLFKKWEIVYFTQDAGEYAKVSGKLINNNIKVKTKMMNQGGRMGGRLVTYKILVKKDDVHKANNVIHHGK
ncbi:hypothetical protein [Crassaminicella profunda]|uniref:hypothetical protein n=1 Tax=Crassaminicella profunda TaxID=1286698 RepID=UPI001CA6D991|nr:hypothetical protein [Crassaminicella profunda]QZY54154.1 hypothetical protein K7H06_14005 [Crassaminicella profunda]